MYVKNPPIEEAQELIETIVAKTDLPDLILLDQWRRNREKDEWRLTYLGNKIDTCDNDCDNCSLYQAVGEEDSRFKKRLETGLLLANHADLRNFFGNQRYLNCKSIEQYAESFISCFINKMHHQEAMLDELDYVAGFRAVYFRGQDPQPMETELRLHVIAGCLAQYDQSHRQVFLQALKEIGLTKP